MKNIVFLSLIWFILALRQVYAYYQEIATSKQNVFTYSASVTVIPTIIPTFTPSVNHVLISEVQTKGSTASQDFIEFYNPTSNHIDLSGWKIRKRVSSGAESSLMVIPPNTSIEADGYLLWANTTNGYNTSIGADIANTGSLADNNSIALLTSTDSIIDQLAWGTGTNQFKEGLAYPDNPGISQSLERIHGVDTDHNKTDFVLRLVSQPQNKLTAPD